MWVSCPKITHKKQYSWSLKLKLLDLVWFGNWIWGGWGGGYDPHPPWLPWWLYPCTYTCHISKLQTYVFHHYKAWERKLVSVCFLKKLKRQNKNWKSMTRNYLEKEKFQVIVTKEKLLQDLYLQLKSTTAKFLSQQKYYFETLQAMEILLLKAPCKDNFGHYI